MPKEEDNTTANIKSENIRRFFSNMLRNPINATIDAGLFLSDLLGAPTHHTNFIRDVNNATRRRVRNTIEAGILSVFSNKSFSDLYNDKMDNGSISDIFSIEPLINSNSNYSKEELEVIDNLADNKGRITNKDYRREKGHYGALNTSLRDTKPLNVIEFSLGQTGASNSPHIVLDVYDFNNRSKSDKSATLMYINNILPEFLKGNFYPMVRGIAPNIGSKQSHPDKYKIKTVITR